MEDLCDLPHVTGWEPYNRHDLAQVSRVGSVLFIYTDSAQDLITAAIIGSIVVDDLYDNDDLYDLDRDTVRAHLPNFGKVFLSRVLVNSKCK